MSEPNQPHPSKRYPICGARRRQGGAPCRKPAGWGTPTPGYGQCKLHCGSAPNNQKAARRAMARDVAERLGVAVEADPDEALRGALAEANGLLVAIKSQIEGRPVEELRTPLMSGLLELFGDWVDRVARIAKASHDAGISRESLDLRRHDSTVRLLGQALDSAVRRAGLDAGQADVLRSALSEEIHRLAELPEVTNA